MKFLPCITLILNLFILPSFTFAANPYPYGIVTFYNASPEVITAQINQTKLILTPKQSRDIKYQVLSHTCAANTTLCKIIFLSDGIYAGFATMNIVTGVFVSLEVSLKILISKDSSNIVRHVSIEQ